MLREKAFQLSRRQRHRGPDSTGVQSGEKYCIVQERLSIIGLLTGKQPLLSGDGSLILAANGEIYNYQELAELISTRRGCRYTPRSDSDVIMAMYEEFGVECASMLWGMFGFIIYEKEKGTFFAARDGLGVCSLYYGFSETDGRMYIASEMKCIPCSRVKLFPPGCYLRGTADNHELVQYYNPLWSNVSRTKANLSELRRHLEMSVRYHLSADVPVASLLSGGLNSSIITAIAAHLFREQHSSISGNSFDNLADKPETGGAGGGSRNQASGFGNSLRTLSVGMKNSPDLIYARHAAEFLGTNHTEIVFDLDEGFDLIPELIWHLETYDPFAIRNAVPLYILSRAARAQGIKVILSGEGADEIFGGFLYHLNAPSDEEFEEECRRGLFDVHLSDGLRASKTSMAQSVELRAPFLGSPFVNYAMHIQASDRRPAHKYSPTEPTAKPSADGGGSTINVHGRCRHCITMETRCSSATDTDSTDSARVDAVSSCTASGGGGPNDSTDEDAKIMIRGSYVEGSPLMGKDDNPLVEKWLLRKAFEDILPSENVWRQKEQCAAGVGPEWVEGLKRRINARVSDEEMARAAELYPYNSPKTKEEYFYRKIFDLEYPGEARARTVVMWRPKWVDWQDTTGLESPFHWTNAAAVCQSRLSPPAADVVGSLPRSSLTVQCSTKE